MKVVEGKLALYKSFSGLDILVQALEESAWLPSTSHEGNLADNMFVMEATNEVTAMEETTKVIAMEATIRVVSMEVHVAEPEAM